jgi:3-methyladenine DNA glycosylase AlkD
MHPWLEPLYAAFAQQANARNAAAMRAYMKDKFPFFGIKADKRRALVKEHIDRYGAPTLDELPGVLRAAFDCPEREMHQVGVDLAVKHAKKFGPQDLALIEELIVTKSWWDSVDALAVNVVGVILKRHPSSVARWNARWMKSDNLWLNRTAILFQLKWKSDTDQEMLFANIDRLAGHKDFFIRKAIGWALRGYAETASDAVLTFVHAHALSPLSQREALRKIDRR